MPPLPPTPGPAVKLIHSWAVGVDANAIVRVFAKYDGPTPDAATLSGLADNLMSIWALNTALWHPTRHLVSITAEEIYAAPGTAGVSTAASLSGTSDGAELSAAACLLVNMTIDRHYRGGKPRSYWPLGDSGMLDDAQRWDVDPLAAFQSFFSEYAITLGSAFYGPLTLAGPVNVGYYSGGAMYPTSNPDRQKFRSAKLVVPNFDSVQAYVANVKVASQRRRNLQRT